MTSCTASSCQKLEQAQSTRRMSNIRDIAILLIRSVPQHNGTNHALSHVPRIYIYILYIVDISTAIVCHLNFIGSLSRWRKKREKTLTMRAACFQFIFNLRQGRNCDPSYLPCFRPNYMHIFVYMYALGSIA